MITACNTTSTPARVSRAKDRLRMPSICILKNGIGCDHSPTKNSTSSNSPPPSNPQIRFDSNQSRRLPCRMPITNMQMAGKPSSTPRQLKDLKRSRRRGSRGKPYATAAMAIRHGAMICQKVHCQPTYSVHNPANGVPRPGPNVAVRA
ncbi:hypothetical protein D3C84_733010 [compost metagenome]